MIFLAGPSLSPATELYSVSIAGGATPALIGPLPQGQMIAEYSFTPDGASVLMGATRSFYGGSGTLFKAPSAGGPLVEFAAVIRCVPAAGGPITTLLNVEVPAEASPLSLSFAQAPRGGPVVYNLTRVLPESSFQLLASVPLTGGAPVALHSFTGPLGKIPFVLSEDGASVLFTTIQTVERQPVTTLFRVGSGGGAPPVQVSGAASVGAFGFAADGGALFIEEGKLFYRAPGRTARRVDSLAPGSEALAFSAAGQTVVFTAVRDQATSGLNAIYGTVELYATDLSASTYLPLARR